MGFCTSLAEWNRFLFMCLAVCVGETLESWKSPTITLRFCFSAESYMMWVEYGFECTWGANDRELIFYQRIYICRGWLFIVAALFACWDFSKCKSLARDNRFISVKCIQNSKSMLSNMHNISFYLKLENALIKNIIGWLFSLFLYHIIRIYELILSHVKTLAHCAQTTHISQSWCFFLWFPIRIM